MRKTNYFFHFFPPFFFFPSCFLETSSRAVVKNSQARLSNKRVCPFHHARRRWKGNPSCQLPIPFSHGPCFARAFRTPGYRSSPILRRANRPRPRLHVRQGGKVVLVVLCQSFGLGIATCMFAQMRLRLYARGPVRHDRVLYIPRLGRSITSQVTIDRTQNSLFSNRVRAPPPK